MSNDTQTRTTWKALLEPFADKLASLNISMRDYAESLSNADLKHLVRTELHKPTQTNCWWAVYQVRMMLWWEAATVMRSRNLDPGDPPSARVR